MRVIQVLSISGFQSGDEWLGDTGEGVSAATWAEAHAEIERAWARPDVWQGEAGESLSVVIVWGSPEGEPQVFHWSGPRDVWQAVCEDAEALKLYAALSSVPLVVEVLH
jgi:hypothetical protein